MNKPARVLIVDDETFNREVLEQELELLECETATAVDGSSALSKVSEQAIDLVLLDIMMPEISGFDVLQHLKADAELRHIPVIMISADDEFDTVVRCIELGAEDYLVKPFDPILLKARVGACLEKKRLHDKETAYLQEIERQRTRAEKLLHVILPAPAVAELKTSNRVAPRRYENVAILFADIIDFTIYCDNHPPEEVVSNLGRWVEDCEQIIAEHGLEKIKTVGDSVMACANLIQGDPDPVMSAVRCAFGMIEAARSNPAEWRLRAGLHVGTVVAGVVGRDRFIFDLWGDAVNIAARLSDLGPANAVFMSRDAWLSVEGRCRGRPLGPVALKGKGDIDVYQCD